MALCQPLNVIAGVDGYSGLWARNGAGAVWGGVSCSGHGLILAHHSAVQLHLQSGHTGWGRRGFSLLQVLLIWTDLDVFISLLYMHAQLFEHMEAASMHV